MGDSDFRPPGAPKPLNRLSWNLAWLVEEIADAHAAFSSLALSAYVVCMLISLNITCIICSGMSLQFFTGRCEQVTKCSLCRIWRCQSPYLSGSAWCTLATYSHCQQAVPGTFTLSVWALSSLALREIYTNIQGPDFQKILGKILSLA